MDGVGGRSLLFVGGGGLCRGSRLGARRRSWVMVMGARRRSGDRGSGQSQ